MKKTFLILSLVFVFAAVFSGVVFAQDNTPPTDDEVNAIAKKLYCPVCESTPLDVCPTEACRDWREQIRTMLAEGKTEDEILQHFVDQYGDRVLAAPPATGLNWLVYLLPPAVILAGAFILFRSLKEWTKPKSAAAGSGEAGSAKKSEAQFSKDEYVARFEEELKKRK
jgi:cytochrome c-type biogenesis protein CcmH